MLVVTRKIGQRVILDGGIAVEVVSQMSGGKVRLGISAPSDVGIWREELLSRLGGLAASAALDEKRYDPHPEEMAFAD